MLLKLQTRLTHSQLPGEARDGRICLSVNKYLVWGKLVEPSHPREGAGGYLSCSTHTILLILSHISAPQGGGTLRPPWHNSFPDGAQPPLSVPQRHPALREAQPLHLGDNITCGFTSPLFLPPHAKYIQFEKHGGGKATVKRNPSASVSGATMEKLS